MFSLFHSFLSPDDVLTTVDGMPIQSVEDAQAFLDAAIERIKEFGENPKENTMFPEEVIKMQFEAKREFVSVLGVIMDSACADFRSGIDDLVITAKGEGLWVPNVLLKVSTLFLPLPSFLFPFFLR